MARFSLEIKYQTVKSYLEGRESLNSLANKLGTPLYNIRKWVALYEAHGKEGLFKKYTNYSVEFKMDVLKFLIESGASLLETAARFNIPAPTTILQWKRSFEEQGVDALQSKKRGRPSMKKESKKKQLVEGSQEALLAELEFLRMENAYLKKLNALVQKERESQNVKNRK